MKKFISAICVIALMMPSTLSVFADAGTADNLSGQQAVVVDVADSTENAAETETETVVRQKVLLLYQQRRLPIQKRRQIHQRHLRQRLWMRRRMNRK